MGSLISRKALDKPLNHPCQYFYVAFKSTFQVYFLSPYGVYLSCGGIDTLADSSFLSVCDKRLHYIALLIVLNCFGLFSSTASINGNAYIAVP